jgi:SAM-dependent methyltransferase
MDSLPLDTVSVHELLLYERRHRYELGRELCRGMRVLALCCRSGGGCELLSQTATTVVGVDEDTALIDLARATAASDRVSFEVADPVTLLDRSLRDRFEAIVCLEGWERLREPDRLLVALRRHADAGMKLVCAVANGGLLVARDGNRTAAFGYEAAVAAFAGFPQMTVLPQYLIEGSVICPPDAESIDVAPPMENRLEIESADRLIFCVGFSSDIAARAARGRVHVAAPSIHSRYVMNLEAVNRELLRAHARLARAPAAIGGAAATGLDGLEPEMAARDDTSGAALARAEQAERERDLWRQRCLAAESRVGVAAVSSTEHPQLERPVQAAGLDVQEVASGLIVHQVGGDGLHYLNNTAAVVFQLCDGDHTVPEISAQLALAFGLTETRADLAEQCIKDLRAKGVLS